MPSTSSKKPFLDLLKDAEAGDVSAMCDLGSRYAQGEGVEKNLSKAIAWLKKAADNYQSPEAMLTLGILYYKDKPSEAFEWYKKGSLLGDPMCTIAFGSMFGEMGKTDKEFDCYWRTAKAGHPFAMVLTAQMYENGIGVECDTVKAIEWYKKGAALNEENAIKALERLGIIK